MKNLVTKINLETPLFLINGKSVTDQILDVKIYDIANGVVLGVRRHPSEKTIIMVEVLFHGEKKPRELEFDYTDYNPTVRNGEIFIDPSAAIEAWQTLNDRSTKYLEDALSIAKQVKQVSDTATVKMLIGEEDGDDDVLQISRAKEKRPRGSIVEVKGEGGLGDLNERSIHEV